LSLLKAPGLLLQFAFFSAARGAIRQLGGRIVDSGSSQREETDNSDDSATKRTRRRTVEL
ncbi:MAG: hypothetical protein AABZ57_02505, partial [Candidatus Margulisiibacteriota bacterium]